MKKLITYAFLFAHNQKNNYLCSACGAFIPQERELTTQFINF